jgi:hypothetical protein
MHLLPSAEEAMRRLIAADNPKGRAKHGAKPTGYLVLCSEAR